MKRLRVKRETPPLKLDFVCGLHPREGFGRVACRDFGQRHTADLRKPWPWKDASKDASVLEAHTPRFVEHLTAPERFYYCIELYREPVPGSRQHPPVAAGERVPVRLPWQVVA